MPHIPLSFRDPPPTPAQSLAPPQAAEALGVGLPADLPPRADKPPARPAGPRRRTLRAVRITEKPVSLGNWDVNPLQIEYELGT